MAKLLILSLPNLSRCDSSSSRSTIRDLKGRFVVLLYAIIHGKIVKKNFFLVSSLSKSSPPSSLDSSKILSHVSRYFIYIYRNIIIFTTLPRLRESRKVDNYLSTYPIVFTAPFRRGTIVGRTLRSTWTIDKDRAIRRLAKEEDDGIIGNVTRSRERKSYKYVILPVADG